MSIPQEIVQLIFTLLPGFVTTWVFYGLTAYRKPNTFERVVEALIFTTIIQALVWMVERGAATLHWGLGVDIWPSEAELALSIMIALMLGLASAWCSVNNTFHPLLWKWRFTSGSAHPSEWFKTLHEQKRWVILNLEDGRRIFGWPIDWPDQPDHGHFVLQQAEWLAAEGESIVLDEVAMILVPVEGVEFVELLHHPQVGSVELPVDVSETQPEP